MATWPTVFKRSPLPDRFPPGWRLVVRCKDVSPYSLLFVDLDGTLVGREDIVSPRTITALNRAQAAGCTIVICTARSRYMVEAIAAQWQGHGYAILSNGAVIAEWETGVILQKLPLSIATVQQASRIAHSLEACPLCFGVHVEEDGGKSVYTDRRFPLPPVYLERSAHRLVYQDNLETQRDLSPVAMGAYGPRDQIQRIAFAWRQSLGPDIAVFESPDAKYGCWCALLNSRQADKALAAKRVALMLNVPRERTMAIGDHTNDLDLLRWAGMGVCMGDGHEEARTCADHVTSTLPEDGAAQAIERFVLGA